MKANLRGVTIWLVASAVFLVSQSSSLADAVKSVASSLVLSTLVTPSSVPALRVFEYANVVILLSEFENIVFVFVVFWIFGSENVVTVELDSVPEEWYRDKAMMNWSFRCI